jgi:hypothetical protein
MKHKTGILLALLVATLLIGAFYWGGSYPKSNGSTPPGISEGVASTGEESPDSGTSAEVEAAPESGEEPALPGTVGNTAVSPKPDTESQPPVEEGTYRISPAPAGTPAPVEPKDVTITDEQKTCTLSISCKAVLDHMELLDEDKWELIPEDGVLYGAKAVTFYEGESVLNVLQREMKQAGIQMEFQNTPVYNTAYILGIANLYEFDVGELSGWVYEVNGWFPNYGCSRYQLQNGDVINWHYTCDLGKDVGGNNAAGS